MSPDETTGTRQAPPDGAESRRERSSASEPAETPTAAPGGRTEPRAGGVSSRTGPDDTGAARELSAVEVAYNVAQSELFQLAAYGHHTHAPLHDRETGKYLSIRAIEAGQQDYNNRIWAAEYAFEAAVLRKAADAVDNPASAHASNKIDAAFMAARTAMSTRLREMADQLSPPAASPPADPTGDPT